MKDFLFAFRNNSIGYVFKRYWFVFIFGPIVTSFILVIFCGNFWMAMMAGLCRIDFYRQYFPYPFGNDFDAFVGFALFLFFLCYFCFFFFKKLWLLIPSVFFLTFTAEVIYEKIIYDDYRYIGDDYFVFLDEEKVGVMDCCRNIIIQPTYKWFLPCFEYSEDGSWDNQTYSKLVLCIFCENEKYYAFTRFEQLVEIDRIVLNPKYKKKNNFGNFEEKKHPYTTLVEHKRKKSGRLWDFRADVNDENVLGYFMSVDKYNKYSFNNPYSSEYHFISKYGGYLGSGSYYILGLTEEYYPAIAFSNDNKIWNICAMQCDNVVHYTSSDEDLTTIKKEYLDDFDSPLEYYGGIICSGVCLSNRIDPDDDSYLLESQIPSISSLENINYNTTPDPNYYPTNHLVTKPHTCGICSGTGHCSNCYGRGLSNIGNHSHICGACGGSGWCAT